MSLNRSLVSETHQLQRDRSLVSEIHQLQKDIKNKNTKNKNLTLTTFPLFLDPLFPRTFEGVLCCLLVK